MTLLSLPSGGLAKKMETKWTKSPKPFW